MKIICTNEEKQAFINACLKEDAPCLFPDKYSPCKNYYTCEECLEGNIEWEIVEQREKN